MTFSSFLMYIVVPCIFLPSANLYVFITLKTDHKRTPVKLYSHNMLLSLFDNGQIHLQVYQPNIADSWVMCKYFMVKEYEQVEVRNECWPGHKLHHTPYVYLHSSSLIIIVFMINTPKVLI